MQILPPPPPLDAPDDKHTHPDAPEADEPLAKETLPLESPDDDSNTRFPPLTPPPLPLPLPLHMVTHPPRASDDAADPPQMQMLPPPAEPVPVDMHTSPPRLASVTLPDRTHTPPPPAPDAPAPTHKLTSPPAPAPDVPVLIVIHPLPLSPPLLPPEAIHTEPLETASAEHMLTPPLVAPPPPL